MKRAAVIFLGLLALWACDRRDDDDGFRPPSPVVNEIRCRAWSGNAAPIVVATPIDPAEAKRLHLCFVTARTKKDCGCHRAGCYYGCPKEACGVH